MVWGSQQEIGSGGLRTLPGLGFSRGVDPDSRGLGIHLPPGPENGERRALRASCGLHSPLLSFSGPHCLFLPSRLIQSQPEVLRWGAQEGGSGRQDKGLVGVGERGTAWPTLTSMALRKLLQCLRSSKAAPHPPVWTWVAWMGIGGWETGKGRTRRHLGAWLEGLSAGANGGQTSRLPKADRVSCGHRGCPCKPSILPTAPRS